MNDVLHLRKETGVSLRERAKALKGYHKFSSILHLPYLGLHTADGLILRRWSEEAKRQVLDFCETGGFSELLLRTDKAGETGRYPRGGYLVPLDIVECEAKHYLDGHRLIALLEPLSSYADDYSFNVLIWEGDPRVVMEVVGPGFDASDLKRGDLTPHETISLDRSRLERSGVITETHLRRTAVTSVQYRESVRWRLSKIGRSVASVPICRSAAAESGLTPLHHASDVHMMDLAKAFLKRSNNTHLLEHSRSYQPIPLKLVQDVLLQLRSLSTRLQAFHLPSDRFVVSGSFVSSGQRLVYWDIVWPSLKYTLAPPLT